MVNFINKLINFKNFIIILIKSNFISLKMIGPSHGLDKKLTISITAKYQRFLFLNVTLKSIFNQSIHPDEIILWIEKKDKYKIPKKIIKMKKYGLKILYCNNLKSYNKLIHTLKIRKNNYIVTFDDDMFYNKYSLEHLVKKSKKYPKEIISNRIHGIVLNKNKLPIKYNSWNWNLNNFKKNKLNFQTGVYGVLYPPKCFYKDVLKSKVFKKLSPYADDVWFYWMIRLKGKFVIWSGFGKKNFEIYIFERKNLRELNIVKNYNNLQIQNMIKYYGFPK